MWAQVISSIAANKLASLGVGAAVVFGGGAAAEASGVGPGIAGGIITAFIVENVAPLANDDSATTDEDVAVIIAVLDNDTDDDDDVLSILSIGIPSDGAADENEDGTVTYTPPENFYGEATFDYTIEDGNGGESTGTVTVTVEPVNDPPDAVDDEAETEIDSAIVIDVLANDTDVEGDPLTVASVSEPDHASVEINEDGTLTVTPEEGFEGAVEFTYIADDGNGGQSEAAVELTVGDVQESRGEAAEACREDGWEELGFRNQGLCTAFQDRLDELEHGNPWPLLEDWDAWRAEKLAERADRQAAHEELKAQHAEGIDAGVDADNGKSEGRAQGPKEPKPGNPDGNPDGDPDGEPESEEEDESEEDGEE